MWRDKLNAAGAHLLICIAIAIGVLSLVYLGWYRHVLASTQGVGTILLILLSVDVVLGPALTLLVYKKGKKTLVFDLAVIGIVQCVFLVYGLMAVEKSRPAFLVFAVDRFEAVSTAEWDAKALASLEKIPNPASVPSLIGPVVVGAIEPMNADDRKEVLASSLGGGSDLPQMPQYYGDYAKVAAKAAGRSQLIEELIKLNPTKRELITALVRKYAQGQGLVEAEIGFLPLKGKDRDATTFVNRKTGAVLGFELLEPWK
jgi:hypothetical protein